MIVRIFLSLAVFGAVILVICHGNELNNNESEAEKFLSATSDLLFKIINDETYNGLFSTLDSVQKYAAEKKAASLRKINKAARKFDFENFKDEELKYEFKTLLQGADVSVIKPSSFSELFDSLQSIEVLKDRHFINDFHDPYNVYHYSDVIEKVIKKSNDLKELQYYWEESREIADDWAKYNIDNILNALKKAAKINHVTALEFWLRNYNISDMENLMADIQPLYMEAHAFIRNLLRKKYGESVIAADGLIPDHLFDQVLHQAPTNESVIDEMFPFDSLPPVESVMAEKFKAQQLYEIAEEFYGKLGFEKHPSSFWGDRIKLKTENEDDDEDDDDNDDDDDEHKNDDKHKDDDDKHKDDNHEHEDDVDDDSSEESDEDVHDDADEECHIDLSYSTPDILLKFCEKLKFKDFLHAYAVMGYLHYAKEMLGLPAYFFKPPQGLEHAIGKAVILSASTYQNLQEIGMTNNSKITQEIEMNRLLRMAIISLINLPSDFVLTKVMADLVSGSVKKSEIGKHYWNLMEKYAGVGPPKDHKISEFDLPYSFYHKMTYNYMSRDFTTEILSYQIHKKLCELSGKYPKEQLHLCNINGSNGAGSALKIMMRFGSSKPFDEVLGIIFFDNPTVNAEGFLEYYSPIKKLLEEKNKKENVSIGWKNSNSKKS